MIETSGIMRAFRVLRVLTSVFAGKGPGLSW